MMQVNNLQGVYDRYLHGTTYENIYKAYNKPSRKKVEAWQYCKDLCNEFNGNNLKIISASPWIFTAGFTAKLDDGCDIFVYITKQYDRYMEI